MVSAFLNGIYTASFQVLGLETRLAGTVISSSGVGVAHS